MTVITVNLPRSLRESLDDAVVAHLTTRSRLIAIAVREWLEREYPEYLHEHPEE